MNQSQSLYVKELIPLTVTRKYRKMTIESLTEAVEGLTSRVTALETKSTPHGKDCYAESVQLSRHWQNIYLESKAMEAMIDAGLHSDGVTISQRIHLEQKIKQESVQKHWPDIWPACVGCRNADVMLVRGSLKVRCIETGLVLSEDEQDLPQLCALREASIPNWEVIAKQPPVTTSIPGSEELEAHIDSIWNSRRDKGA